MIVITFYRKYLPLALGSALTLALTLTGCAPTIPLVMTSVENAAPTVPQDWESHGAYYLIDETQVMTSYESNPAYNGPITKWLLHQEIQITNADGVKWASMEVPYSGNLVKWTLIMQDSAGKPMPLDTAALKRQYLSKRRIDFPNAHAGCRVGYMITLSTIQPVSWTDHWFSSDLPVLRGVFAFHYSGKHYEYDFKEYGGLAKGKEMGAAKNGVVSRQWEVNRQSPRSKIGYQEGIDITAPRLALVMREALGTRLFEDWGKSTERYEAILMDKSFFASERSLRRLTDSLVQGKTKPADKAAAILAYCQDHLTLVDGGIHAIKPDAVLKAQKGTLWEITVVAKTMLEEAGLQTRIWLTRPRDRGGIDPDFITPGALMLPLMAVEIDTAWRMFFPFRRGYALGEYESSEFSPKALLMSSGELEPLPEPTAKVYDLRQEYDFDLARPDSAIHTEMVLVGRGAMYIRNALYDLGDKDIREHFQEGLRNQARQNALISAKVDGLKKRGEPLKVSLSYASPNQVVERKGKTQIRIGHLFDTHFDGLDSARTTAYFRAMPVHSVEVIRLQKPAGRKARLEWSCLDQKTDLFEVRCERGEDTRQFTLTRTLDIRAAKVAAYNLRKDLPALTELNRIREATVYLE